MLRRFACLGILVICALQRPGSAQTPAPLEIGVLPNVSPRVLIAQYQPMREYLARAMQRPVQVSTAPDWRTFQQRTLALEYDVVVTAVHLARVAQLDRGYVPLLRYVPNIKGLLLFASSRPLRGVPDLAGHTLVLSNPQSLVTLRGMQWLAEEGLQRDKDFKTISTPTDDSAGSIVVRGDAMAALVSAGEYRAFPEEIRAQLQMLTTFAEVPGFIVLASPRLSASETQAIKDHLRRFAGGSEEGKSFFGSTGFTNMTEVEPGLMESMDPYVAATRWLLSTSE